MLQQTTTTTTATTTILPLVVVVVLVILVVVVVSCCCYCCSFYIHIHCYQSGCLQGCNIVFHFVGCEGWTLYRHHILMCHQFHLRCLRKIAHIKWQEHVPNTTVLKIRNISGIEALLQTAHLRWCGHAIRMDNTRISKQVFYVQLHHGQGRLHKGGRDAPWRKLGGNVVMIMMLLLVSILIYYYINTFITLHQCTFNLLFALFSTLCVKKHPRCF